MEIGIHDREIGALQRVLVDINLELDPDAVPCGDTIDAVLDYDFLRREIAAMAAGRRYALQETLCQDIVALCMGKEAVIAATVMTGKPDIYADCDTVSYRISARA
jgi:dihydroneopterin aldolase